jgi:positive regulator of sigma E activity
MPDPGRSRTKNTRRADAFLGYLIPLFFVLLAGYQQVTAGKIDKYVIGALLVFGLGALGWRIDTLFEKYLEAKAGLNQPSPAAGGDDDPT